jgi:hypothetical protein
MVSEGNGFATRDSILRPLVRRFKVVEVADWGKFRIRSLTELERSRFEASCRDKRGNLSVNKMVDLKCRMIVMCVVDADGNQLLANGDIDQLRQQDSKATNALVEAIQSHCGFSDEDLEDLEKNSEATAAAASQ